MTIHKEGYKTIALTFLLFGVINILSFYIFSFPSPAISWLIFIASFVLLIFIISFFRIPKRNYTTAENVILAPADGKIVTIEEIQADEYFNDKRLQVSIFMSPLNVHVNRNPVSGEVTYSKYHKGKYLVAWHPKSSTLNERHSIVLENAYGSILVKQIAGAMAKRICNYAQPGQVFKQGEEFGFIKFGSRVDVLLPLNATVEVKIGDVVKSGVSVIASLKDQS